MLFLTVINRAVKPNMCSQACILSAKYQSEPEHIKTEDVFFEKTKKRRLAKSPQDDRIRPRYHPRLPHKNDLSKLTAKAKGGRIFSTRSSDCLRCLPCLLTRLKQKNASALGRPAPARDCFRMPCRLAPSADSLKSIYPSA